MRILHFYKSALPESVGGIEHVMQDIALGCSRLGMNIDVLALTRERTPRKITLSNGVCLYLEPLDFQVASTGFSRSVMAKFRELSTRADIVHYHFPWPFMDVVHFYCGIDKPYVVTYHSDIIRQRFLNFLYAPLKRKFLVGAERIVATSPNYLSSSDVLAKLISKVNVIPIGIDHASYPTPDQERVQYWSDRFGGKFFLFVGVLRYYKGLKILIEAARGLDYPIVIVGAGPIEAELKLQVIKSRIRNVIFLGYLDDSEKVALLKACYAFVFPSQVRSEAFGVSLLEAAMFGKPMISSEIGTGTTFINIANVTGLVVPPSNPLALRNAMEYLWNHPDEASSWGENAKNRYWQLFTAERMIESYAALYKEILT